MRVSGGFFCVSLIAPLLKALFADAGWIVGHDRAVQRSRVLHVTAVLSHRDPTEMYSTVSQARENVELNSKNKTSCVCKANTFFRNALV